MSSSNLFRWSGLAIILCSLLLPISWILDIVFDYPRSNFVDSIDFVGLIMLVFGLIGIYGSQTVETGLSGFLGFLLTIITTCIAMSINWLPENGEAASIGFVLAPIMAFTGLSGYILLGIGSWKADKLPRWSAVLWPLGWGVSILGMVLVMSGFEIAAYLHLIGFVVWGIGCIGAGVRLRSI